MILPGPDSSSIRNRERAPVSADQVRGQPVQSAGLPAPFLTPALEGFAATPEMTLRGLFAVLHGNYEIGARTACDEPTPSSTFSPIPQTTVLRRTQTMFSAPGTSVGKA
jgi:hypothetical protein